MLPAGQLHMTSSAELPMLLRMSGISKTFPGVRALDQVNFAVDDAEIHAFLGENGAGKSTLLKILSGAQAPNAGTIELAGQSVSFSSPQVAQQAGIATIYQEFTLAPDMTVAEIFVKYGEPEFRRLERSVIARLLGEKPRVLATGGGAYMDETNRAAIKTGAFTIWLKAPIDILLDRVRKRQEADQTRPLLANDDMRGTLERLLVQREPAYALADMVLESGNEPHAVLLDKIVVALAFHGLCEGA